MAITAYIINSNQAQYTDADFSAVQTELYSEGVFNMNGANNDLKVVEHSPADMSVDVGLGGVLIEYLKNAVIWKVIAKNLSTANLSINPNSGGSNRVDAVVMHLKQTEPDELRNNVAELLVVDGTGATALTDGDINTAVGDTNWYRLSDITVAPAAISITNSDIADTRAAIHIGRDDGGYANVYKGDGSQMSGILVNPMNASLLFDTDSTYDIGQPAVRVANVYADFLWGDGSNLTNVATANISNASLLMGEPWPAEDFVIASAGAGAAGSIRQLYGTGGASYQVAQQFTFPTYCTKLVGFKCQIQRVGTPNTTNMQFDVYAQDGGGLPTGSSLGTAQLDTSYIGSSTNEWYDATFSSPLSLTPGGLYVLVAQDLAGTWTGANYYSWNYHGANVYTGGDALWSTDGGSTWSPQTAYDQKFEMITDYYGKYPLYIEQNYRESALKYTGQTSTVYAEFNNSYRQAQSFYCDDFATVNRIDVYMTKLNAPTGQFFIQMYAANVNGEPTGGVLYSAIVNHTSIPTGYNDWWTLSGLSIATTPGNRYVIITWNSGSNSTNLIQLRYGASINTMSNGYRITTTNAGGSWSHNQSEDCGVRIYTTPQTLTKGRLYRVRPDTPGRERVLGYNSDNIAKTVGQAKSIILVGTVDNIVSTPVVSIGDDMYVSSDGWNLTTTQTPSFVGIGLDTDEVYLKERRAEWDFLGYDSATYSTATSSVVTTISVDPNAEFLYLSGYHAWTGRQNYLFCVLTRDFTSFTMYNYDIASATYWIFTSVSWVPSTGIVTITTSAWAGNVQGQMRIDQYRLLT